MSYKRQEQLTLREHMGSSPVLWWGPCCLSVLFFVLSYYVELRSEFSVVMYVTISHKAIFGSSLPPFVCRTAHVLFVLFVFVTYSGVQHVLTVYISNMAGVL